MLAFTPTPLVNWPFAPHGSVLADPGHGFSPGSGVFIMLRGKLKPPLSRSLHNDHTLCEVKLSISLATTADVQFANPAQYAGFIAASKNGCAGITFGIVPAPQASVEMWQPNAFSMFA